MLIQSRSYAALQLRLRPTQRGDRFSLARLRVEPLPHGLEHEQIGRLARRVCLFGTTHRATHLRQHAVACCVEQFLRLHVAAMRLAHLTPDPRSDGMLAAYGSLDLGTRPRDAVLVAVEDRQLDFQARPDLEPIFAFFVGVEHTAEPEDLPVLQAGPLTRRLHRQFARPQVRSRSHRGPYQFAHVAVKIRGRSWRNEREFAIELIQPCQPAQPIAHDRRLMLETRRLGRSAAGIQPGCRRFQLTGLTRLNSPRGKFGNPGRNPLGIRGDAQPLLNQREIGVCHPHIAYQVESVLHQPLAHTPALQLGDVNAPVPQP